MNDKFPIEFLEFYKIADEMTKMKLALIGYKKIRARLQLLYEATKSNTKEKDDGKQE